LSDEDAKWFAKVQSIYHPLQKQDTTVTFGSIPGKGEPYGFKSSNSKGAVCTVVNPSQQTATMELPVVMTSKAKILYADGGYKPSIKGNHFTLGAEQLVVVGFDEYADGKYHLGVDNTINIPSSIHKLEVTFTSSSKNTIEGQVNPIAGKNIRIIMQQFDKNGLPYRSWPGSPPDGKKVSEVLIIKITQDGKELPLHIEYDKVIWSGLSWAAGEIKHGSFDPRKPINIQCITKEKDELKLNADVYAVAYASA